MKNNAWWQRPLRVIQTNLQVQDTPRMNPAKIAQETADMGANALVMNVGGIYAWYRSKIPFHHVNEYLPDNADLLQEILEECHKRDIRVIARFDFSKAEDKTFQQHPEWFVRFADGSTRIYGKERPGNWSLLMTTCTNAGYRNEELAVPVVEEVLSKYEIDGIFFNAPHYEFCVCDTCKQKYLKTYGKPMPEFRDYTSQNTGLPAGLEKDWPSICLKDNMELMYRMVKEKAPQVPIVLYYNGHQSDHLSDRVATADFICTESQDILSLGHKNIPQSWHPAISMRMGRTVENYPKPFGIIHSCPGMDWRHTGLPTAEYEFWMSQIPANGGLLWHSITGFCDTISDKRVLKSVSKINHMTMKIEDAMDGAESIAEVVLLWEGHAEGMAEALIGKQYLFDIMCPEQITEQRLSHYKLAIIPEGFPITDETLTAVHAYVKAGGNIIVENASPSPLLAEILGIDLKVIKSEYLAASYLRFEDEQIMQGFEETPIIAHRGVTRYCKPNAGTKVFATLIPPFAPLDAVGSPPERASILCPQTSIPLCTVHKYGKGRAMYITFGLGALITEFRLEEHLRLLSNLIHFMVGDTPVFSMNGVGGLQATAFQKGNSYIVHLVNGVGQRPLTDMVPLFHLKFDLRIHKNQTVKRVRPLIDTVPVTCSVHNNIVSIEVEQLHIWNAIQIECD